MVQSRACPRLCGGILVSPQLLDNAAPGVYSLIHAYQKMASLYHILRKELLCSLPFSRVVLLFTSLWVDYID